MQFRSERDQQLAIKISQMIDLVDSLLQRMELNLADLDSRSGLEGNHALP